ncbi:MAG: hypothetical protein JWR66_682 [Modestobacter sp.]|nr:hypothetical protein [Modestobacter sp.]
MTEEHAPYPVRVDAALDAPVSRWLWLVKWLLLIPHAIVLFFLWIAFIVVSVVAFFAILVTGRYPRALFDFNLGVLRWTWRVQYYSYSALGTDRYPPFTLAEVPDYPAHLHVEYPERLSRGLVLVKWWLLGIPHYLVVAVFAGGGLWLSSASSRDNNDGWAFGGLIGLLVFVAGIVLLFTGRYPRPIYDFVLGMDRWVLRVAAYAALMTDQYPPFRLDMGGTDPGSRPVPPLPGPIGSGQFMAGSTAPYGPVAPSGPVASGPVASGTVASGPHSRWTGGRIVALVVGALFTLVSTGLLIGGGALLWADRTQRDDGWLSTPQAQASTDYYALVSDDITLHATGADWVVDDVLGRVRLQVTPQNGTDVFVGVAPSSAAAGYLRGVGRTRVELGDNQNGWSWNSNGMGSGYRMGAGMMSQLPGGPPATAPGDAGIWTASTGGTGTQTLEWTPSNGDWTVVVMPVDGSAGLDVGLTVAVTAPALPWLAGGLLVAGAVLLGTGVLLIVLAVHRAQSRPTPPTFGGPAGPPFGPGPDPADVRPTPVGDPTLTPSGGPR